MTGAVDLSRRAAAVIGAPYRLHGRDPDGWDCWGCVGWARQAWLGRETPGWDDAFDFSGCATREAFQARTAAFVAERLARWRRLERPEAGAVVLLRLGGRPAHVGLMLNRRDFLEARAAGTGVQALAHRFWAGKVEGFFDA